MCVCWRFYIIALTCSGRRTELKLKKNEALPPNSNFRVWFDDVTGRKTGDRHSYFLNTGARVQLFLNFSQARAEDHFNATFMIVPPCIAKICSI